MSQNVLTTLTFKDSVSVSSNVLPPEIDVTRRYTLQFSALLSRSQKYLTGAQQRSSSTLFLCPRPTHSLFLSSLKSLTVVNTVASLTHTTQEELEARCVRVCVCTEEEECYTTAQYSPVPFIAESELTQSRGDIAAISPLATRQVRTHQRGRNTAVNTV